MTRPASNSFERWPEDTDGRGAFQPQKPYPNGVTVWHSSRWLGNGFGNQIRYVAVSPSGHVVGRYSNERYRVTSWVLGDADLDPDHGGSAANRSITTTRLVKWRRAVKALEQEQLQ